ncbi:MAG: Fic family protein [Clostridia bacterium]|nr:Fic family protein [Clostridia bacterium]
MSYNIDALTNDCYEGTTCLINKFNITDEEKLKALESAITFAKASELEHTPINGNFDFEHYKSIHKYLFEDLYDWAGKIRTVDMAKKGTQFVPAKQIEYIAEKCFERLKNKNYFRTDDFDLFLNNIVDFYCVTNSLHPFREGNGRTQRIFISQLLRLNGYEADYICIDNDDLIIATIQASNGVTDYLKEVFEKIIVKAE